MTQRLKFYTQNQFWSLFYEEIILRNSLFPHLFGKLSDCPLVPEWVLHLTSSWIWLMLPGLGESELVLFKNNAGKYFVPLHLTLWLRDYVASLRVGKLGMNLGIHFNISWALISSSVKPWTFSRVHLRSLATLTFWLSIIKPALQSRRTEIWSSFKSWRTCLWL